MTRRILTHVIDVAQRVHTVHHITREIPRLIAERRRLTAVEEEAVQEVKQLKVIDLRGLQTKMLLWHIRQELAPMIIEALREKEKLIFTIPLETRILLARYGLPLYKLHELLAELTEEYRTPRGEVIHKPKEIRPEILRRLEQYLEALIEKYYYMNYPDLITAAIDNLIVASEKKTRFIKPLNTTVGKQKLVMELYHPYYMEYPLTHNLLGLKLTFLTLTRLLNRFVTPYIAMSMTGQQLKTKPLALAVQKRKLEVKWLANNKKHLEKAFTKQYTNEVPQLTKQTKLELQKTREGEPLAVALVFHVLGYRKVLRVWQTRQTGYPEDLPYWMKPHIEVIVTRRAVKVRKVTRIPKEKLIYFNRDAYLKMMKKYRSHH